ncbi:hypothetical protein MXB_358, partial [Myxobolus squamalis]
NLNEQDYIQHLKSSPTNIIKLTKLASLLSKLNIFSPTSALELLTTAKSLSNLIDATPNLYEQWVPGLTPCQAQTLYHHFNYHIHSLH